MFWGEREREWKMRLTVWNSRVKTLYLCRITANIGRYRTPWSTTTYPVGSFCELGNEDREKIEEAKVCVARWRTDVSKR